VSDRALRAGGDDELVGDHAAGDEDLHDRRLDAFGGQGRTVDDESGTVRLRSAQQLPCRIHSCLGGPLRAPDAGELRRVLHPPTALEELELGCDRHAGPAQTVGEARGEGPRDCCLGHAERRAHVDGHLEVHLLARQALLDQLVVAELLVRVRRRRARECEYAVDLERGEHDMPCAVPFHVEERVGYGDRHLVPHLGGTVGVRVDQDVGQRRRNLSRSGRRPG
jgi:hypothetical protein